MRGNNVKNIVLVADDDLFMRKVVTSALGPLAEIVEVTDGAQVEEVYAKCMPDIIFLDIHLPNISGMELIHRLLKKDKGAYIIIQSSDSSVDNVRTSKLRGAKTFLTKPFDKKRILQIFNNCPTIKFVD